MDPMIEETAKRIFGKHQGDPWALWQQLEESGLTRIWADAENGGFDLPAADGLTLIRLAGAHAAEVPLAETLIATRLLGEARLPVPDGPLTLFFPDMQTKIVFGAFAQHLVEVRGRQLLVKMVAPAEPVSGVGLDPRTERSASHGTIVAEGETPHDAGLVLAALARSAQICGALDSALSLSVRFAEEREQFGRPLARFQAIQHRLSDMAAETAAATAALDFAADRLAFGDPVDWRAVAVAKITAGTAAGIAAEQAHQIHGAIGYTAEYSLASLSRRLWQWRDDYGGEAYWATWLGEEALMKCGSLWSYLAA